MYIRLFIIVAFIPLQSCSNTLIGEKLEKSFNTIDNQPISASPAKDNKQKKSKEIKKIKSNQSDDEKKNKNINGNILKENSISNKDRFSQKSTKSIKKVFFNPQPYRIILKLSGANPSAPAETVTNALRKAGVQFEVEKIERFDEGKLIKDINMKK